MGWSGIIESKNLRNPREIFFSTFNFFLTFHFLKKNLVLCTQNHIKSYSKSLYHF